MKGRLYLEALPGKPTIKKEQQGVCKRLQVIAAAGCSPEVGMHTGISNRASAENLASCFANAYHSNACLHAAGNQGGCE